MTQLEEQIAAAIEVVSDPGLTPAGHIARILRRVESLTFSTEAKRAQAGAEVAAFAQRATKLLEVFDYEGAIREARELYKEIVALTKSEPAKPPIDEVRQVGSELTDLGYAGIELDSIVALMKPGERIGRFDRWEIEIGGRKIAREELRQVLRPVTHQNDSTWLAQFPPIPAK